MTPAAPVEIYRNLTRRAWSVRVGGRVVGHVPAIALVGVTLRASDAARLRCLRTGARDVHAWARGLAIEGVPRPAGARRFRYRLDRPGFRLADGAVIAAAAAAWFEPDGTAWCLSPPDAPLSTGGIPMRLRELTPEERATVEETRARARETLARIQEGWVPGEAALAEAPFLDDYEERIYPGTALTCLAGLCYGHPRLGDRWVCTSPILHRGPTWALTEYRLYILGRQRTDTPEERLLKILSGRRGAYRPFPSPPAPPATPPRPADEGDDDLPPIEP